MYAVDANDGSLLWHGDGNASSSSSSTDAQPIPLKAVLGQPGLRIWFQPTWSAGLLYVPTRAGLVVMNATTGEVVYFRQQRVGGTLVVTERQVVSPHYFNVLRSATWECMCAEAQPRSSGVCAAGGAWGPQQDDSSNTNGDEPSTLTSYTPPTGTFDAPTCPPCPTCAPCPTQQPASPPPACNASTVAESLAYRLAVSVALTGVRSSAKALSSSQAKALTAALAKGLDAGGTSSTASTRPAIVLTPSSLTLKRSGTTTTTKSAVVEADVTGVVGGLAGARAAASSLRAWVMGGGLASALQKAPSGGLPGVKVASVVVEVVPQQ